MERVLFGIAALMAMLAIGCGKNTGETESELYSSPGTESCQNKPHDEAYFLITCRLGWEGDVYFLWKCGEGPKGEPYCGGYRAGCFEDSECERGLVCLGANTSGNNNIRGQCANPP